MVFVVINNTNDIQNLKIFSTSELAISYTHDIQEFTIIEADIYDNLESVEINEIKQKLDIIIQEKQKVVSILEKLDKSILIGERKIDKLKHIVSESTVDNKLQIELPQNSPELLLPETLQIPVNIPVNTPIDTPIDTPVNTPIDTPVAERFCYDKNDYCDGSLSQLGNSELFCDFHMKFHKMSLGI
jgi:hypothetical protein